MQNALAVIDRLIREHDAIRQNAASLVNAISDEEAVKKLAETDTANLAGLLEALRATARGLESHFNLEETGLMAALDWSGDRRLSSAFSILFVQHEALRGAFAASISDLVNLLREKPSGKVERSRAKVITAHLSTAIGTLRAHAASEDILLWELKASLLK